MSVFCLIKPEILKNTIRLYIFIVNKLHENTKTNTVSVALNSFLLKTKL